MRLFGLIGCPLTQSFSQKFFTEKFQKEGIANCNYALFEIDAIQKLKNILDENRNLEGFNVTIPYKEAIIPYLNEIDGEASSIGACNCIKISDHILKGYNTDAAAFEKTLLPQLKSHHTQALILGTGGAAKAVAYILKKLNINYQFVSRSQKNDLCFTYESINSNRMVLEEYSLIINATPLGSYPIVNAAPDIPYNRLHNHHYLYDLVYNPSLTVFLKKGQERGATVKNGYDMLVEQALMSWTIWNRS